MDLSSDLHSLECRSLSFMTTLAHTASWFSRIYRPPLVAQFLKDVSLTAHSGEIHGVVGVAGSGKSTLLEVIAARAQGDIGGTVLLDKHLLTKTRFSKLCVYISFRTRYPGSLSVRSLIYYHARLSIGGTKTSEIERLVDESIASFDLPQYMDSRLGDLSESARRRVIVAMQLITDPLLVIIDDVIRGLDPLPSFHLMSCLSAWAKRKNRVVLVSMRTPRSDIYQLLNRMTILYYGEVFYSGFTKQMPAYFKSAGFTCPQNENPAVYYLSLATVDRETSERYKETQEQALRLIDQFRVHSVTPREGIMSRDSFTAINGAAIALSYLERPSNASKLNTLVRRTFSQSFAQWPLLVARFLLLPALFLILLSVMLTTSNASSRSLPFSAAGGIHLALYTITVTSLLLASACFHPVRALLFIESSEDVYPAPLAVIAYCIVHLSIEILSVSIATTLWLAGPTSSLWLLPIPSLTRGVAASLPLFVSTAIIAHSTFLTIASVVRSSLTSVTLAFIISAVGMTHAGGFTRHIKRSSSFIESLPQRLNCFTYISRGLNTLLIPNLANSTKCVRNERQKIDLTPWKDFCRWPQASSYLSEMYPDESFESGVAPSFPLLDTLFTFIFVIACLVLCVILYSVPKPRKMTQKFKYF